MAVIKSFRCNCRRESGYCRSQRGISRSEAGGNDCIQTLQVPEPRGGRKLGRTILEANNTKFKEQHEGWVLAADKPHHLLFIPHRYLVGILCKENETNTREPVYPFKLQALFFFFYCPPVSSWIVFKLPRTLMNSAVQLAAATASVSTSHTYFSLQMSELSPGETKKREEEAGSSSGSVWPSALFMGKVTARICFSKRSAAVSCFDWGARVGRACQADINRQA